jgi:hypothetical protein
MLAERNGYNWEFLLLSTKEVLIVNTFVLLSFFIYTYIYLFVIIYTLFEAFVFPYNNLSNTKYTLQLIAQTANGNMKSENINFRKRAEYSQ